MTSSSYPRGLQDKPLLAMSLGAGFDQAAARVAEREALLVGHRQLRYSWAQLGEAVDRCGQWCVDPFKVPRHCLRVDELPVTVTDEVRQFRMGEFGVEPLALESRS